MSTPRIVGGTEKSTQEKVALYNPTYHPLIDKTVLKTVSKTVLAIEKVLVGERKLSVNFGGLLLKLKNELNTHFEKSGRSAPSPYQVKMAFLSPIQVRFKIGENRANEYIKLAERKDLHRINLPTSVLIELSRLSSEELKELLKRSPSSELKKMSFKDIKKLVRGENSRKRNKSSKSNIVEVPPDIAETLKSTFEIVKDKFDDEPSIDKDIDSVLGEISEWYFDKKVA